MKPVDLAERRRIVTELDRTFLVEAGAGSGKTKSLVDRMIACLRGGVCSIDSLAAVTFTRKAAAELRERFQTNLERAYAQAEKEGERRRLGEALRNLEQCFIGTIHSFCARMLRERPIEIALMPDFQEMDEIEDGVFREKCWLDYLVAVRRESPPDLAALVDVGLEPEDLKDAFTMISLYPEVRVIGGRDAAPDFDQIRGQLEVFLERMRIMVPFKTQAEDRDDFQKLMARVFVRGKNIGFEDSLVLMNTIEDLDKSSGFTYKRWPDKDEAKKAEKDFEDFQTRVVKKALKEWREYRHSRIINFLKPAVRFYYEQRKTHSLVNFADLLLSVSSLLRNNPHVRAYFQKKFTHILVDEFQDTDPVQAEILMYLTGTDTEEKDWRKLAPKPGSLFLVGDPKQSIYRFRRADIDTYNVAREQILESGGDVLKLTANFRSLGCLGDWNNPIFEGTFPKGPDRYQAPFAPIDTVRGDGDAGGDADVKGTWSGVHKITVERKFRHNQKLIAQDDADAIADWISWACSGNVKFLRTEEEAAHGLGEEAVPSDFLVLFRRKKLMGVYARALEERGIPYEITGTDAFTESDDILEIVNLARALFRPDNQVFLVAVLRGIFFGASDNALFEFKRAGGRFSFLEAADVDGSQDARYVAECLKVLKRWWQWTRDFPASTALEMIFEDSGIVNYLASSETGSSRAGNVLKLLEFVRSHERAGNTAFSDVVEYVEELAGVREVEEMSLTPGRADAVRLMNLHKAKGLEATVVFLAMPKLGREFEPDKHVVRLEEGGPRGNFLFKRQERYQEKVLSQPLHWADSAEEEKKYEEAEEDRLMYVAATRAKDMLVVSTYDGNLTNKSWELLDGYLNEVPELEIPEPGFVAGKKQVEVSPGEYREIKESLKQNIEAGHAASYLVESVTSLAKGKEELPGWSEVGRGMRWGRAVHGVLEAVGRRDGAIDEGWLDTLAGNCLGAEEIDLNEKPKLLDLVRAILESEFWERVQRAEQKHFEVPFSVKTDSDALGIDSSGGLQGGDLRNDGSWELQSKGEAVGESGNSKELNAEESEEPDADGIGESKVRDANELKAEDVTELEAEDDDAPKRVDSKAHKGRAIGLQKGVAGKSIKSGGGHGAKKGNGKKKDVILTGTIDLAFLEEDGWVIADYKTDQVSEGPCLKRFVDYYAPQVRTYTKFWEQITGQKVKESGLYFTALKKWIAISQ